MDRIVSKKAPDFSMEAVTGDGETFMTLTLDSFKNKWLILFFYPMDFTFVCPTEITRFSQDYSLFQEAGAEILAVSTDSVYCHQAWIRGGLGVISYPIAADKTMRTASDYGVLLEDQGVALRGLFIIDPQQNIRYSVVHDNQIGRSTEETLRVLKALQTDGLCGANWSIGSQPLQPGKTKEAAPPSRDGLNIKIYALPGCSYCKSIKDYLDNLGLAFEEIDLETDLVGQRFMDDRGYTALPVTVIDGHEISGYRMDKIKELLKS